MAQTAEDIRQLNEKIQDASQFIDRIEKEIARVIIGQHHMVNRLQIRAIS